MSTPNPRDHQSQRNSGAGTSTPSRGLQRLPSHTRYPLTPSRLVTVSTPSQRSASRYTPRARPPATPYGLRALQQRAANQTPGRDRRRSVRVQRETTFDILRNLGRALAPISQPIQSSPQEEPEIIEELQYEIDELDNESPIEPPRMSLPLQEVDDESDETSPPMPPRMSIAFDDDDITYRSVEYPRDMSARDQNRLSIMDRLAGRMSETFGAQLESDSDAGDETGIVYEDDAGEDTMISDFDRGGETEDLGRFHFDLNFPSPTAVAEDPMDEHEGEMDGFELSAGDIEQVPRSPSDDDDDAGGGFDYGFDFPQADSPSQSPGIVGGGLREEDHPVKGKLKKLSRYGIPIPNLPVGVVKNLATRFARNKAGSKPKLNKAAMAAIEQASSWFFEQASQDLAAYSKHAGRKTIDESDVITLMRRQRHINKSTTVFSLAQKHLPKELQQDMRVAMPP
ncbi:hypothetical protein N7495_009499 [Penicillium taxi]|uniref:uncharacterized protein n=1 Tax=Penicillium taxi TaxID=168475 RepID=UPI0025456FFE|nr:uncharacterized protein N7495_009499 [Penicillium taxi]KAJ5884989.1 hypothetical protein N7495_009499 [Penicillium taxi]